jgi:type IV secretion system protein VirD4
MIWRGVPLGFDREGGAPISYDGDEAVLVFGPPGASKTVGFVVPQLLDDDSGQRSYVVIDPKGEVCAITSRFRRRCGDVKIINPYGVLLDQRPDMKSDGWNPLSDLDPADPHFADECAARGDALIKTNANETQPIFPNSARSALTAGINFEVRVARVLNEAPSLPAVRAMLTLETEQLVEKVKEMIAVGDPDIATRMRKFLSDNREIQSIKSNIETDTAWMTKPMREDMALRGGVDFRVLKQQPTTIYIIIPPNEIINKAPYLRLVLSTALRHLYHQGGAPATLLVEEAFVLGHLTELENAASILRGYGSRLVTVFQFLSQIQKLYPNTWGLFGGGAVLGFRPGDMQTAEWMVKKAGTVTRPVLSAADPSGMHDQGVRPSWQAQRHERIPLDKMFGMPRGTALVWLPGDEVPRVARTKGYFEIPQLARRADPNPYYAGRANGRSQMPSRRGWRWIARAAAVLLVAAVAASHWSFVAAWFHGVSAKDRAALVQLQH